MIHLNSCPCSSPEVYCENSMGTCLECSCYYGRKYHLKATEVIRVHNLARYRGAKSKDMLVGLNLLIHQYNFINPDNPLPVLRSAASTIPLRTLIVYFNERNWNGHGPVYWGSKTSL